MSFPMSHRTPVRFSDPLPEAVDLVVIGGGVIGVSTALFASRCGLKVALIEKGRIAGEQSSRNWGWVRVQGRDLAEVPVALEAQQLWQALETECHGRLGLRQAGVTYLAKNQDDLARYEAWLTGARPLGVSSHLLDAQSTREMMGKASRSWTGGLHTPTDMRAEPWQAVPELASLARAGGVILREDCAVQGLDLQAGQVRGVYTAQGDIKTEQVVLAGGAWSSLFLQRHGLALPQLSVRSHVVATTPVPEVVAPSASDDQIAFRRREDGGYTLAPSTDSELFVGPSALRHALRYLPVARQGAFHVAYRRPGPKTWPDGLFTPRRWAMAGPSPFDTMPVLNPTPDSKVIDTLIRDFRRLYPEARDAQVKAAWTGMIDTLPDVVPVVDHVADVPGLIVATGMSGHGFGIGPAFGRILADLAVGAQSGHDMSRFRWARFSDGSRLVPPAEV
jgi:glycine/D-amino acid oxidase-like deaminating enzyme